MLAEAAIGNACAFSHDPTVPVDFTDFFNESPLRRLLRAKKKLLKSREMHFWTDII